MSIIGNALNNSNDISSLDYDIEKAKKAYKEERIKDRFIILRYVDIVNFLKTDCIDLFPDLEYYILDMTSFLENDILYAISEYKQKNVYNYKKILREIYVSMVEIFKFLNMPITSKKFDRSFKIWNINKRKTRN